MYVDSISSGSKRLIEIITFQGLLLVSYSAFTEKAKKWRIAVFLF